VIAKKSVDPDSGSTVEDGQTLTYTLTFENPGAGTAEIDFIDHMQDVLDDADLTGEIIASAGAQVAGPIDGQLLVSGVVAPGDTATVVYKVTVKDYNEQGNHRLGNYLTLSDQTPPDTCTPESDLCTENPVPPKSPTPEPPVTPEPPTSPAPPQKPAVPDLPRTGPSGLAAGLVAAFLTLLAGAGLIAVTRDKKITRRN